jgi:hypothetical protein
MHCAISISKIHPVDVTEKRHEISSLTLRVYTQPKFVFAENKTHFP